MVSVVKTLLERMSFTQDVEKLLEETNIPLFVYGNEKTGGRLNHVLKNEIFLGSGRTVMKEYALKRLIGDNPILVDSTMKHQKAAVIGEVYAVSPQTILMLDHVYKTGSLVERRKRWVWLDGQFQTNYSKTTPSQACWVYMGTRNEGFYDHIYPSSKINTRGEYCGIHYAK